MLSNLRRDLTIRHLVNGLDTYDPPTEVAPLETFSQLILRLAGTEYQNGLCIANARNDCGIVDVEMSRESSLAAVIPGYPLRFVGTLQR